MATVKELKDTIVDIWDVAENADGSRSGMSDALDAIQEHCSSVVPNVEDLASPDEVGADDVDTENLDDETD